MYTRDRLTWLLYIGLGYFAFMQAIIGPLMPFLRAELNLSYAVGALHISAFAVGMILTGVASDALVYRLGRRNVFWGGAAGMAFGALLLIGGQHPALTVAASLLMGICGSATMVIVQAALNVHHPDHSTTALTEANVAASGLSALAPAAIGISAGIGLGWRFGLLYGVLLLIGLYLMNRQVKLPPIKRVLERSTGTARLPLAYWAYWLVLSVGVAIEWCMVFWGADYLHTVVGLEAPTAATLMTLHGVAMIAGRYVGSRLTRRLHSAHLLYGAYALIAIGFPLFWLVESVPLTLVGLFITGTGVANLFPLSLALSVSIDRELSDAASARASLGGGIAILVMPQVLGALADAVGLQAAFGVVPLLLIVIVVMAVIAARLTQQHFTNQKNWVSNPSLDA